MTDSRALQYTDDEWQTCLVDVDLRSVPDEAFGLLHRHWIWAKPAHTLR